MRGPVKPEETITRFLVHSNEYKVSLNRPTFTAYMPDGNGEKSVYRTSEMSIGEVREIGQANVAPLRGPLKGHADQTASAIFDIELTIEPDTRPHPRHANIKGWKDSRPENRNAAQRIAETASLHLY